MKRRKFIASMGWLTAGMLVAPLSPVKAFTRDQKKIKGSVQVKGKGLKNVVVSDGYSVVTTDASGKYEMEQTAYHQYVIPGYSECDQPAECVQPVFQ